MSLSISAFGMVTQTCAKAGVSAEWSAVFNGPPDTTSPEFDRVAIACADIWNALVHVLQEKGNPWLTTPTRPQTVLAEADFSYLGSINLPKITVFDYLDNAALAYDPADGSLLVSTKGGGIQRLAPLPDPVAGRTRSACPTAQVTGPRFLTSPAAVSLTSPAGTLGGFAVDGDLVWITLYEFYNVAGRDNWGVVATPRDLSGSVVHGPYRVGPTLTHSPVPNTFHANKTHDSICPVDPAFAAAHFPGKTMASFRWRPAGAFGAAFGPGLNVWAPTLPQVTHDDLGADCLLCYPNASLWDQGFRNAEGEDNVSLAWIWTKSGKSGVLYGITKGLMDVAGAQAAVTKYGQGLGHANGPNYYGLGPAADPQKGWHAFPYEPRLCLYSPAAFAAVTQGALQVHEPQPVATWRPDWVWNLPADGTDPNSREPWFGGMCYDPNLELLYVLQPMKGAGSVLHVVQVS